jgi:hypothetical protein
MTNGSLWFCHLLRCVRTMCRRYYTTQRNIRIQHCTVLSPDVLEVTLKGLINAKPIQTLWLFASIYTVCYLWPITWNKEDLFITVLSIIRTQYTCYSCCQLLYHYWYKHTFPCHLNPSLMWHKADTSSWITVTTVSLCALLAACVMFMPHKTKVFFFFFRKWSWP